MARTDSWIGLSPRGQALVAHATPRPYATHDGMCNRFPLQAYALADGREVCEVVQTDIWASGPSWFLTLATRDGIRVPGVDWTDQELADTMGFSVGEAEPTITAADAAHFTMSADSIRAGTLVLHWAEEQKFLRWQAAIARGEGPGPTAVPRLLVLWSHLAPADRDALTTELIRLLGVAGDPHARRYDYSNGVTVVAGVLTPELEAWLVDWYPGIRTAEANHPVVEQGTPGRVPAAR